MNTYKILPGVNALRCPKCAEINARARKDVAPGSLFVSVGLEALAHMRAYGVLEQVTAACHFASHVSTVQLEA